MNVQISVLDNKEIEQEYSEYFHSIKLALKDIKADIKICYDYSQYMIATVTIYAKDSLTVAKEVKEILLSEFPEDIEQISAPQLDDMQKNMAKMNMLDFLYEG